MTAQNSFQVYFRQGTEVLCIKSVLLNLFFSFVHPAIDCCPFTPLPCDNNNLTTVSTVLLQSLLFAQDLLELSNS